MKVLVVVDMQNDFIDGSLGTAEALKILPNVKKKLEEYRSQGFPVIFTRDTHTEEYLCTQEGRNLPVAHCIKGTLGWQIHSSLDVLDSIVINKPAFGTLDLPAVIRDLDGVTEIELIGICTDICVISNAMIMKAAYPEILVSVDAACCAGVTPESHNNALEAMKMCQIQVIYFD